VKLDPLKKLKRIADECQAVQQEITKNLAAVPTLLGTPQVSESKVSRHYYSAIRKNKNF
jgi:hypothetical protein